VVPGALSLGRRRRRILAERVETGAVRTVDDRETAGRR